MPQRIMTRLNLQDMKELTENHELLKAVIESLDKTSWAGARTAKAAVERVDRWIADLYNRAEPYFLRYLNDRQAQPAQDAPAEPAGGAMLELTPSADGSEPGKLAVEQVDSTSPVVSHGADELPSTIEVAICDGDTTRGG